MRLMAMRRRSRNAESIGFSRSTPRMTIGTLPKITNQPIRASGSSGQRRAGRLLNQAAAMRMMSRPK